jgi:hypothetical protein
MRIIVVPENNSNMMIIIDVDYSRRKHVVNQIYVHSTKIARCWLSHQKIVRNQHMEMNKQMNNK